MGGVGASIWDWALHFFHFIPSPHQGTCQPPKGARDTGEVPRGGRSQPHLAEAAPASPQGPEYSGLCREKTSQWGLSRSSCGGRGARGLGLHMPPTYPTPRPLPAAALGRGGAVAPELSAPRASLRAAQPTAAAATVPWLGNESPPGGGSRPPTMASLSFPHSPLHPFCCQPPPLNPAPKTKAGWTVEGGGSSILALTSLPCKPSWVAPGPNQESWVKLPGGSSARPQRQLCRCSEEPNLLRNGANYKEEKERLLNISNVPR